MIIEVCSFTASKNDDEILTTKKMNEHLLLSPQTLNRVFLNIPSVENERKREERVCVSERKVHV